MQEHFEEFEKEKFSDIEIYTKIWSRPRAILRYIHEHQYEKNMYILLILIGIVHAIDRASYKNMGDTKSLTEILFSSIIFGGLFGWISFYFYSSLVSWTGRWLKGNANRESFYRMFTYSMIPAIHTLVFLFVQMVFFEGKIFSSDFELEFGDYVMGFIYYSSALFSLALSLYSIALCVIGTSIVQNFSIGKSILNLLLPIFLFIIIHYCPNKMQ
ncbi:MAG: Yip1 family protein [Chitinophagales bacterium]